MSEMAAGQWRIVLEEAHEALRTAVEGVPADAWEQPTPCERWNVTQVLQHAVGDQLAFAAAIDGGPGPAEDPFTPSGRVDGDKLASLRAALDASARAWQGVADDDAEVPTPLPQGKLPAKVGAVACALDAAVHAWDIAVATGQSSPLGVELARPCWWWPGRSSSRCGPMARTPRRSTPLRRPARSPPCSPTSVATPD